MKVSVRTTSVRRGGGRRGIVAGFTRASRKRMLECIARLEWKLARFVCFVTLTYPDRNGPPTAVETDRDRQVFCKRLKRLFPRASAIWRREWKPRESGKFVGVPYPHYHFLFFRLPFFHYDRLNALWGEVLGYDGYIRTEIEKVESWYQALGYVAKYMAKVEVGSFAGPGANRREANAPGLAGRSLVYVAYLTADEGDGEPEYELVPVESIGRSWGCHNKRHLPWAKRRVSSVRAGLWLELAKRRARQVWPGIGKSQSTGFTLFSEDADKLYDEILALRLPGPR